MCDDNSDAPSATSETWRRARKSHLCCACGEEIHAGDRYHYTSGIWDGRADSFKHCARCMMMLDWLMRELAGSGDLVQFDLNCGEEYEDPPPEIADLAFMTRAEAQALVRTA